jgi:hypothetical protein
MFKDRNNLLGESQIIHQGHSLGPAMQIGLKDDGKLFGGPDRFLPH